MGILKKRIIERLRLKNIKNEISVVIEKRMTVVSENKLIKKRRLLNARNLEESDINKSTTENHSNTTLKVLEDLRIVPQDILVIIEEKNGLETKILIVFGREKKGLYE